MNIFRINSTDISFGLLIWACVWGIVSSHLMRVRGYSGGFFWGFLLGPLSLIVVLCYPSRKTEKE